MHDRLPPRLCCDKDASSVVVTSFTSLVKCQNEDAAITDVRNITMQCVYHSSITTDCSILGELLISLIAFCFLILSSIMYAIFNEIEVSQTSNTATDQCSICQEFLDGVTMTCTICRTGFCRQCLEQWFVTMQPCRCPHRCELTLRDKIDIDALSETENQVLMLHRGEASDALRQAIQDLLRHPLRADTSSTTLFELDEELDWLFVEVVYALLFKLHPPRSVVFQLNYSAPQRFFLDLEKDDEEWVLAQWHRAPERNFRKGHTVRKRDLVWLARGLRARLLRRARNETRSRRGSWSMPESNR